MLELNKIYNEDCLEGMKKIPDKSIDLILTDPPYGISEAAGKNLSRGKLAPPTQYTYKIWDNKIPDKLIFDEMFRISKNQIIFGGNYFIEYLTNSPCWLVWDKLNGKCDFADCELAWTSFKSAVRKFEFRWHGMFQQDMKNKEKRYHPTQKPVKLFQQILEKYSNENDIILDPFMGSGTTAIACRNINRRYIGFELDKEYFDIANKRINEVSQIHSIEDII